VYAGNDRIVSTAFNQMLPKLYAMMIEMKAKIRIIAIGRTNQMLLEIT
jgi:hypothetical protein